MSDENEYQVRLIIDITAETPEDAVETFIEALVSRGLRDWKYKVVSEDGEELLLWGSTLEEVTREELLHDAGISTSDFFEEDEDPAKVQEAFEAGEHGETAPPVDDEGAALALAEELVRQDAQVNQEE